MSRARSISTAADGHGGPWRHRPRGRRRHGRGLGAPGLGQRLWQPYCHRSSGAVTSPTMRTWTSARCRRANPFFVGRRSARWATPSRPGNNITPHLHYEVRFPSPLAIGHHSRRIQRQHVPLQRGQRDQPQLCQLIRPGSGVWGGVRDDRLGQARQRGHGEPVVEGLDQPELCHHSEVCQRWHPDGDERVPRASRGEPNYRLGSFSYYAGPVIRTAPTCVKMGRQHRRFQLHLAVRALLIPLAESRSGERNGFPLRAVGGRRLGGGRRGGAGRRRCRRRCCRVVGPAGPRR